MTARRSRTSSRAAGSPCGSAARGCFGSIDRTDDKNWVPAARENVGVAADADRPGRQGVHVRRRLEPDDVQVLQAPERGLGAHEVPVQRRSPEGLREPAWACSRRAWRRRSRSASPTRTTRRSSRPSSRAARTRRSRSGAQIENAYKGRFGNILDSAAGQGKKPFSEGEVKSQLDAAAKEADALLAQGG